MQISLPAHAEGRIVRDGHASTDVEEALALPIAAYEERRERFAIERDTVAARWNRVAPTKLLNPFLRQIS